MGRLRVLRFVIGCIFVLLVTACGWPAWSAVTPSRVTFRLGNFRCKSPMLASSRFAFCVRPLAKFFGCAPWGANVFCAGLTDTSPEIALKGRDIVQGMMLGSLTPPCLPWWPLRPSRTYVITVRFPLTDIAWTLHLASPSLRCANKRLSAKHRLPLHGQQIPESRGPPISFPVCLRASSLPRKSRVALLNFHEGPFSCSHRPAVNVNQR